MHIVARNGRVVSAGVDYLTCTARELAPQASLYALAEHFWSEHPEEGEVDDNAFVRGYRGRQTPRLFVGTRTDGTILRASGGAAWHLGIRPIKYAANVSRLDIQATVCTPSRTRNLAGLAYRAIRTKPLRVGRTNSLTHIETDKGGATLYIGRRSSDKYARLYDKGVESECAPPRTLWRYEVELKRDAAYQTAKALMASQAPNSAASAMVYAHFLRRGVIPHYRPATGEEVPHLAVERSNLERRLRWLATSVAPVIAKTRGHVSDATLARLLGFPAYEQDGSYAVLEGEAWLESFLDQLWTSRTLWSA